MTCECPDLVNDAQLTPNGAIEVVPTLSTPPVISSETPVSLLTSVTDAVVPTVAKVTALATTVPMMGWIALGLGFVCLALLRTMRSGDEIHIHQPTIRTNNRPQFKPKNR